MPKKILNGIVVSNKPNKTITVNLPALFKVINKVESMSELVKFFSDSPLK